MNELEIAQKLLGILEDAMWSTELQVAQNKHVRLHAHVETLEQYALALRTQITAVKAIIKDIQDDSEQGSEEAG